MSSAKDIALLPDAGPLISLAYADALDVLFKPGWRVMLVDMVLHEVTRNQTPTSNKLAAWVASTQIPVRRPQDCTRQLHGAKQLPEDQHQGFSDFS